jgi:PPP family 3-phenylpropionic acid transporter
MPNLSSNRAVKTLFSLYIFFIFAALGMLLAFMPLHYKGLGFNGLQISSLNVLGSAALILLAPRFGLLVDHAQNKRAVLILALLVFAISLSSIAWIKSFLPILLLWTIYRTISGPLYSTSENLSYSIAAKTTDKGNASFGSIRLWGSIGYAVATLLAGWVYQNYGLTVNSWLFLLMVAVSVLILILIPNYVFEVEEKETEEKLSLPSVIKLIVDHRFLLLMALALALSDPTQDGVRTFEPIYMQSLGLGAGMIGLANMLSALGEVPFMIYADRIIQKFGIRQIVLLVFIFDLLRRLAVWFFPSAGMVFATSIITSFSFTFRLVSSITLINLILPKNVTSTANAFIGVTMFGVGYMISNALAGFIYDNLGNREVYLMGASFAFISIVLALIAARHSPNFETSQAKISRN